MGPGISALTANLLNSSATTDPKPSSVNPIPSSVLAADPSSVLLPKALTTGTSNSTAPTALSKLSSFLTDKLSSALLNPDTDDGKRLAAFLPQKPETAAVKLLAAAVITGLKEAAKEAEARKEQEKKDEQAKKVAAEKEKEALALAAKERDEADRLRKQRDEALAKAEMNNQGTAFDLADKNRRIAKERFRNILRGQPNDNLDGA